MPKRCLSCGNISDNNLYACSLCLNKIDETRRDIDLKRRFRKDFILKCNKIFYILGIALALLPFTTTYFVLNRFKLDRNSFLSIIYRSLFTFIVYFILGMFFARYISQFSLALYSDRNFYIQNPRQRLNDKRTIKLALRFLFKIITFTFLAWFVYGVIILLLWSTFSVQSKQFLQLGYFTMKGFAQAGFLLGLFFLINKYSDWIKGLEK